MEKQEAINKAYGDTDLTNNGAHGTLSDTQIDGLLTKCRNHFREGFAIHEGASLGLHDVDLIGVCKGMKGCAVERRSSEDQRVGTERLEHERRHCV